MRNPSARLARGLREFIAASFWAYVLVKLFVFDVDLYLARHLFPAFEWILELKAFVFIASAALAWLVLGNKRFAGALLYILAYPLILLLWKAPVAIIQRWPLMIAFAPVIYRSISTFPKTVIVYTAAIASAFLVITSSHTILLLIAMFGLASFLVVHLSRSTRTSYSPGLMAGLSSFLKNFRDLVQRGTFDNSGKLAANEAVAPKDPVTSESRNPASLYLLSSLTEIVLSKVDWVTRSRKYDLYLMASWLYTAAVTSFVFALLFLGLEKIDPLSFGAIAQGTNLWGFLGFSLGNLTPARVSPIVPLSRLAVLLTYAEGGCALLILVILVFAVLTAARESYKRDMDDLGAQLRGIAAALDQRVTEVYRMTIMEVELILLPDQADLVNGLRKARGLPELAAPKPAQKTAQSATSPKSDHSIPNVAAS